MPALDLLAIGLLLATAWVLGRLALRLPGLRRAVECEPRGEGAPGGGAAGIGDALRRAALPLALGQGLLGTALFGLGLAGRLRPVWIAVLLAAVHLAGWRIWGEALGAWRRRPRVSAPGLLLAVAVLLPSLTLALYPATGFDATVYHLPYAQTFLRQGRVLFIPHLRFPVFPQLVEMGFVLGLVLGGQTVAQLTQWVALLLVALLLWEWGRRELSGPRGGRVGVWAAALWLGTPLAVWIGVQAYVDVGLTLFVTAALYSWARWRDSLHRSAPADGELGWLALAALFAGFAAATKYLGLFVVAWLGVATLVLALRRRRLRAAVVYGLLALATLGPWYLHIYRYTGNPVFPYYTALFGGSEWSATTASGDPASAEVGRGLAAVVRHQLTTVAGRLGFLVLTPWRSLFDRGVFHLQAPLTPWYLALPPVLVVACLFGVRRYRRRLGRLLARHGWLLAGLLAYGLFWLTVRDLRYLMPALPGIDLLLALALEELFRAVRGRVGLRRGAASRRLAAVVTVLLVLPGPLYAGLKIVRRGPLPLTGGQRQAYLAEQLDGYRALALLERRHGDAYTVYALFGERLTAYARGGLRGDLFGPARYARVLAALGSGERLYRELRRQGADHLLVVFGSPTPGRPRLRLPGRGLPDDASFHRRFRKIAEEPDFVLYELVPEREAGAVAAGARSGVP